MALWLWLVQTEIIFQLCVLPSDTKSAITFEWMENKLYIALMYYLIDFHMIYRRA